MGVGIGIVLLAIGLILALAVGDAVAGVDLALIGWILTGVGGLAIVVTLIMTAQRSHQTIEHVNRTEGPAGGGTGSTGTGSGRTSSGGTSSGA
jgi:uncharacterized membrane protein YgcG